MLPVPLRAWYEARAKVWPRGEKEPSQWTIEAADETPNLFGSPGLYGDATLAEVFIDNIVVTPNESAAASGTASVETPSGVAATTGGRSSPPTAAAPTPGKKSAAK